MGFMTPLAPLPPPGNARLVYAILRNKSLFLAMANFDYEAALAKLSVSHPHVRTPFVFLPALWSPFIRDT